VIGKEGLETHPQKAEAIQNIETPKDLSELRRFLGMINYLGRFLTNLSSHCKPLNDLMHKDADWTWGPDQEIAFQKVKELVSQAPVLAHFDLNKETVVCSDASSYGLGGVLYQKHGDELKPVAFCSRSLTEAEKNYAQIEKECLGVVSTCEKFERYLVGLPHFTAITDHKPLIPLINRKDLTDAPVRCQRMLMRLMRFNLSAEYTPGSNLVVADTLSRAPLHQQEKQDVDLLNDVQLYVDATVESWPVSSEKLEEFKRATESDNQLSATLKYVRQGWPTNKDEVQLAARELYTVKDELSEFDGLVVRGQRIVIPFSHRKYVLERIHDGHQGITKCRERAGVSVWWPGLNNEIKEMVGKCQFCLKHSPSQMREPLISTVLPEYPFQKVGVDLCEKKGDQYLVFTDYFSRYMELVKLERTTSQAVIQTLKDIFARYGVAEELRSDNGPQFSSGEFREFAKEWGFSHITSSPKFPQSNGAAERAVETAKKILAQNDISLALLSYRATPVPTLGASPAELAFGRKLRTRLPILPATLVPSPVNVKVVKAKDKSAKENQKKYFDRGTQKLPPLQPGGNVLIKTGDEKTWNMPAKIVKQCAERSFVVETQDGGKYRRNRRDLLKVPEAKIPENVSKTTPSHYSPEVEPQADVSTEVPETATNHASPGPVRTRSGREVKVPLKGAESK
jgi:hypothetical protein